MKKLDIIVIFILALLSLSSLLLVKVNSSAKYNKKYVEIYVKAKLEKRIPLTNSTKETLTFSSNIGKNTVEISEGKVSIIDASCPDKLCIKEGTIKSPAEQLICLPNQFMVLIKGEDNKKSDIDMLSY